MNIPEEPDILINPNCTTIDGYPTHPKCIAVLVVEAWKKLNDEAE